MIRVLTDEVGELNSPETSMRPEIFKDLFDADVAPAHPGEILREDVLPRLGMSRAKLAHHLGISRYLLGRLLSERTSITLDLAQRLGTALGSGSQYWIGLQNRYDLWHARFSPPVDVKRLPMAAPNGLRQRLPASVQRV